MTTFETATLADAVNKAARFAPTKGSALDRSAGVVLSIVPGEHAVVRSTDLNVFFRQVLPPVSVRGEAVTYRVPSRLLASVIGGLPMAMGSTVLLADKDGDGFLYIRCGGVKAKLRLIDAGMDYPRWEPFDLGGMDTVTSLFDRLSQVGWCTEKKGYGILTGVHIDGKHLWATNRDEAVRVPLECPVEHPVTAPLQEVLPLVKDHPEITMRVRDRLEISTDPDTQLELLLLEGPYPAVQQFIEIPLSIVMTLRRDPILAAIDRLLVIVQGERYPVMKVEFEAAGLLRLTIDEPDVGRLIEELEIPEAEPFTFMVTPTSLHNVLSAARQPEVQFHHSGDPFGQYRITDELGYIAAAMPRRVNQ